MKLKVCGIRHNPQEVMQLQPNYMGCIFWEPSVRYFKGELPEFPKSIKKVGVFVDAPLEDVLEKVERYQLDAVQLHGAESPEYCKTLHKEAALVSPKKQTSQQIPLSNAPILTHTLEIIKAFSIKDQFDFSILRDYEAVCHYFLFDTKGKLPGGNGYTFDWSVLRDYPSTKPYFLSGGIGLENIDSLLAFLQQQEAQYCHAIDVNSAFEIEPGHKDIEKLKRFKAQISEVRFQTSKH